MEETGKVGIARLVMRTKEYLVALRPTAGKIELSTMLFADEVVDPAAVEELAAASESEASDRELDVAKQLIGSLASDFDVSAYKDDYRERVMDLIERKAQGEQIEVVAEPEAAPSPVPDLMSALKASLDSVREAHGAKRAKPPAKRAAARKAAKKRAPKSQQAKRSA